MNKGTDNIVPFTFRELSKPAIQSKVGDPRDGLFALTVWRTLVVRTDNFDLAITCNPILWSIDTATMTSVEYSNGIVLHDTLVLHKVRLKAVHDGRTGGMLIVERNNLGVGNVETFGEERSERLGIIHTASQISGCGSLILLDQSVTRLFAQQRRHCTSSIAIMRANKRRIAVLLNRMNIRSRVILITHPAAS
jgi:hypothetical protein